MGLGRNVGRNQWAVQPPLINTEFLLKSAECCRSRLQLHLRWVASASHTAHPQVASKKVRAHCNGGRIDQAYVITGGTEGSRMRLSGGVLRATEASCRVAPGITALYSKQRQRFNNHVETTISRSRQTFANDGDETSVGRSNDCLECL
jgi:hypothetical protein